MDWVTLREKLRLWLKEYRYVILVLFLGIVLMLLPQSNEREERDTEAPVAETVAAVSLQEQLEQILTMVQGAGKVRVLLTEAAGERVVYQTDGEESSQNSKRTDTNFRNLYSGMWQAVQGPYLSSKIILDSC